MDWTLIFQLSSVVPKEAIIWKNLASFGTAEERWKMSVQFIRFGIPRPVPEDHKLLTGSTMSERLQKCAQTDSLLSVVGLSSVVGANLSRIESVSSTIDSSCSSESLSGIEWSCAKCSTGTGALVTVYFGGLEPAGKCVLP